MDDRDTLKSRNLEAFRRHDPELHRRLSAHAPVSKLVFGGDGGPDVEINGQGLYNGRAESFAAGQLGEFWKDPYRIFLHRPVPEEWDEHAGRFLYDVLRRSRDEEIEFSDRPPGHQCYYLIVFGIGLGRHIDELVEKTDCRSLVFVDTGLEFLSHSLEVYDWSELLGSFEKEDRDVRFFIGDVPDILWRDISHFLRTANPCSADGFTYFTHFDSPVFSRTIDLMKKEAVLTLSGLGFFFDEILMLKNAHWNLFQGESRVYYRPEERMIGSPVFIVGSGPSLDKDLAFIKDNAGRAIIISCGSALRPLVVNGVVPDFHIEVENIYVLPMISSAAEEGDISRACLVSTSTSEFGVSDYFDNIVYYFRSALSPYPLFCDSEKYCLKNPGPTVVIAGLSFAQEIGFRDFYFFGVDLAVKDVDRHHAKDSHVYTDESLPDPHVYDITVQANFGGKCHTYEDFFWTLSLLSNVIKVFGDGRSYYNCSDGALIEGAQPNLARSLSFPEIDGGKGKIVREIIGGFPVYSKEKFDRAWNDGGIVAAIDKFIGDFKGLLDGVSTFRDKSYLKPLARFLPTVIDRERVGTKPVEDAVMVLFRGSLHLMVMGLEYYLNRIADPGKARRFEEIARQEIAERLENLRQIAVEELGGLSERAEKGEPPVTAGAVLDEATGRYEFPEIKFRPPGGAPLE